MSDDDTSLFTLKSTDLQLQQIYNNNDVALARVNIPTALFGVDVADEMSHSLIDGYHNAVLSCVSKCCFSTIPLRKCGSFRQEHAVPGWNEYVADKHLMAREAYCNWVLAGKPR